MGYNLRGLSNKMMNDELRIANEKELRVASGMVHRRLFFQNVFRHSSFVIDFMVL